MPVPLLTIIVAAASFGGAAGTAQTDYMRCLSSEVDAAVAGRVDSATFANGAARVCEAETATYRRMAVASIIGQGMDGASPVSANARFDRLDGENRAEMIAAFENRLRLRRGPARIAGLPAHRTQQD